MNQQSIEIPTTGDPILQQIPLSHKSFYTVESYGIFYRIYYNNSICSSFNSRATDMLKRNIFGSVYIVGINGNDLFPPSIQEVNNLMQATFISHNICCIL